MIHVIQQNECYRKPVVTFVSMKWNNSSDFHPNGVNSFLPFLAFAMAGPLLEEERLDSGMENYRNPYSMNRRESVWMVEEIYWLQIIATTAFVRSILEVEWLPLSPVLEGLDSLTGMLGPKQYSIVQPIWSFARMLSTSATVEMTPSVR